MSNLNDKICTTKQNSVNFGVNILTHCTFLLAIICSVFFLFTERIMTNAMNNQIEDLAVDTIDKFYNDSTPENQQAIKLSLQHAQLEIALNIYQSQSEDRIINNKWIEKIIYVIVALLIVVVIIAILISKAHCGNISVIEILSENIIIFMCVGIVEFLFFTKIIIKYIPAYPSTLSHVFVDKLKEYKPPN